MIVGNGASEMDLCYLKNLNSLIPKFSIQFLIKTLMDKHGNH